MHHRYVGAERIEDLFPLGGLGGDDCNHMNHEHFPLPLSTLNWATASGVGVNGSAARREFVTIAQSTAVGLLHAGRYALRPIKGAGRRLSRSLVQEIYTQCLRRCTGQSLKRWYAAK
jgi:hypothetical protein